MHYLLAMAGAITIGVLLWRAIAAERRVGVPTRKAPIAPDDDPDFLRRLSEQQRKKREDDQAG